jgi:hypothetical protein
VLTFIVVLVILNLILIFFIGAFLVGFRDKVNDMFAELIQAIESSIEHMPNPVVFENQEKTKTWDEKYEEELDSFSRRLKIDTGLQDLSRLSTVSYAEPPAPNIQNRDGLIIKDK